MRRVGQRVLADCDLTCAVPLLAVVGRDPQRRAQEKRALGAERDGAYLW